jgi:amino acid permease
MQKRIDIEKPSAGDDEDMPSELMDLDASRYSCSSFFTVGTSPTDKGLSWSLATCTLVNYLATGYILLPWAFAQGGTLLTAIVLCLVVLQTYISSTFVLETCARAETLHYVQTKQSNADKTVTIQSIRLPSRYTIKIRERNFELSLLTKIFLGRYWSAFFTLTTVLDLYGITWAFCSIFASAFHERFPLLDDNDSWSYRSYVGIFLIFATPLACTSLLDQIYIQMVFLATRMLMVVMMLSTVLLAYANSDKVYFGDQAGPVEDVDLVQWSNFVQTTMTCIFATAVQFAVPTLADASRSKRTLRNVFTVAISFNYFTNIVLGILLAVFSGRGQANSSNLLWADFHAGNDPTAGWARFISGFIVLFPALDGIAVYSLIAVSLGEILLGAVYKDKVHEIDWRTRTVFRLIGSIPQAIGALFVSDLGVIASFAGIFTILSYTVCPVLLGAASKRDFEEKNFPVDTHYSLKYLSSELCGFGLVVISTLLICAVIAKAIA